MAELERQMQEAQRQLQAERMRSQLLQEQVSSLRVHPPISSLIAKPFCFACFLCGVSTCCCAFCTVPCLHLGILCVEVCVCAYVYMCACARTGPCVRRSSEKCEKLFWVKGSDP